MTNLPPVIGRTVRRPNGPPAAVPAQQHRPASSLPRPAGPAPVDVVDQGAGRPRTAGRPMPEYPRAGYVPYQLFGTPPGAGGWWARWVGWLRGRMVDYLYAGITCRGGFIRWVEHSDKQGWAGDVTAAEVIEGEWWATLKDTVVDERTGQPWLVFDDRATADAGVRPIRPGELVHTEPTPGVKHGRQVDVFTLHPDAGVLLPGLIVEGARAGEKRIIQGRGEADFRPRYNTEHNEGDHAVNRVRRRVPRLIAMARRRALALTIGWLVLAAGFTQWFTGMLPPGAALVAGVAAAATVLQAAQLVRLAGAGAPLRPARRRPRKPRGSRRRQRRR
jgi:hypothetical protein